MLRFFFFFLPFCVLASSFRDIPFDEKTSDEKASFILTFDKQHTNADAAKGNPRSTLNTLNLGLRAHTGFDGLNAFSPEGAERLEFQLDKNLSMSGGTLIMWVKCGYDIAEAGNTGVFSAVASDGKNDTRMFIYLYKGGAYAVWRSSMLPRSLDNVIQIPADMSKIKRDEWFQLALTWSGTNFKFYLNGEPASGRRLPIKAPLCKVIKIDPDNSWIGFKTPVYDDKNLQKTFIDDIRVYPEPFTPLQIRSQYSELLTGERERKVSFDLSGSGVPERPYDKFEASLDFGKEPPDSVKCSLTGPDGFVKTKSLTLLKPKESILFDGLSSPGKYILSAVTERKGKNETASLEINRPDLSYMMPVSVFDGKIPSPFEPPKVDPAQRTVSVWNRDIRFGYGPLPESITVAGKELFTKAPELIVSGAEIVWNESRLQSVSDMKAELTGSGRGKDFSVSFRTEIYFDGMINPSFTISGKPEISGMSIRWTVSPEHRKYLMTMGLCPEGSLKGTWAGIAEPNQLWLASESGGFCWSAVHNANWRYNDNDFVTEADSKTGDCAVRMITQKAKLPAEEVEYNPGVFIATPTRPLPGRLRGFFLHSSRGMTWTYGSPELRYGFKYDPELLQKRWGGEKRKDRLMIYGTMTSNFDDPFYFYFRKYVEAPGDYSYKMRIIKDPPEYGYLYPCRMESEAYQEYRLNNLNLLLRHPLAFQIGFIYNDLCSVRPVSYEGDFLTDAFGKTIKKYNLFAARQFIVRELALCHKYGKPLMLHGQKNFTPALQGLADYWYPGEQYQTMIEKHSGFAYTDLIGDEYYDSEFNRRVMGVAVMFLPIGNAYKDHTAAHAEALLAAILPHDLEFSFDCWGRLIPGYEKPHNKVWDIYTKYGVYGNDVTVRRFTEQREIASNNRDVRVTYYKAPMKPYLLVIANKTKKDQTAEVDLSKIRAGDYALAAEYHGGAVEAVNGKINVTLPPRSFKLLGLPEK